MASNMNRREKPRQFLYTVVTPVIFHTHFMFDSVSWRKNKFSEKYKPGSWWARYMSRAQRAISIANFLCDIFAIISKQNNQSTPCACRHAWEWPNGKRWWCHMLVSNEWAKDLSDNIPVNWFPFSTYFPLIPKFTSTNNVNQYIKIM